MKELVLPTNKAINLKASILLSAKTFSVHLSRNIVQGLPLSLSPGGILFGRRA